MGSQSLGLYANWLHPGGGSGNKRGKAEGDRGGGKQVWHLVALGGTWSLVPILVCFSDQERPAQRRKGSLLAYFLVTLSLREVRAEKEADDIEYCSLACFP